MKKKRMYSKGAGGYERAPNRQPRFRKARRREMREQGTYVAPCFRQWVWLVTPDALFAIPSWAKGSAVHGLGEAPGRVWLWPGDARRLMDQARRRGWRCVVTRTELRHCPVCARPFIGAEAECRRKLNESGPDGRRRPCGPTCAPDAASRVWKKLNPAYRTITNRQAAA